MQKIAILGAGGLARDVVDIFKAMNEHGTVRYDVAGYIVDAEYNQPGEIVYGKPILGDFVWLAGHIDEYKVICAAGTSQARYNLVQKAIKLGGKFQSAIHPQVVLSPSTKIGQGVIIKAGCLTASQVSLGDHVVLNLGCTVGHDTSLGDFSTLAAGVNLAGYIKVGEGSHLAIGSKIIEKIEIGEWSFIGAGSVVTKNIGPYTVATGTPARPIKTGQIELEAVKGSDN